jgi:hypothetical protein
MSIAVLIHSLRFIVPSVLDYPPQLPRLVVGELPSSSEELSQGH